MSDQSIFFTILIVHFLADFCLQTDEQAQRKSFDIHFLNYHVATYSLVWFLFLLGLDNVKFINVLYFIIITYISHFTTDYITSRIGKTFWDKKDTHNGFVVVGIDQILHYVQLYYCFHYVLY